MIRLIQLLTAVLHAGAIIHLLEKNPGHMVRRQDGMTEYLQELTEWF